jgi:Superinfection immunity protein
MDNGLRQIDYRAMDERDLIRVGTVVAKAILVALVYAVPAILATWWRQRNQERIALLNLTLGWTGIGWLVLLGYVVSRRIRGSRRPRWRRQSRGVAQTEHNGRRQKATAASLRADLDGSASLR